MPFSTKLVAMVPSVEILEKRGPDRSCAPKTLSFGENIAKIGPAHPEIIVSRAIIKKDDKKQRKNAWQSLAYSPLGATMSPPSRY